MAHAERRLEARYGAMLFNDETTLKTDFRCGEIHPIIDTKYVPKGKCYRIRPPPLKYTHTLSDWKNPIVPFDLFGKPKPCVRTNPHTPQKAYYPEKDVDLLAARKTRPRLVMTPSVSLDDIDDEQAREILIKETYRSSFQTMVREVAEVFATRKKVTAPLTDRYTVADSVPIPTMRPPYVSPEWRMDSVSWDSRQRRTYSDVTKEFWLNYPIQCRACDETAIIKAHRKRQRMNTKKN